MAGSSLQFRATTSFLLDGVPHHVLGGWWPSKKQSQRDAAERALAFFIGMCGQELAKGKDGNNGYKVRSQNGKHEEAPEEADLEAFVGNSCSGAAVGRPKQIKPMTEHCARPPLSSHTLAFHTSLRARHVPAKQQLEPTRHDASCGTCTPPAMRTLLKLNRSRSRLETVGDRERFVMSYQALYDRYYLNTFVRFAPMAMMPYH